VQVLCQARFPPNDTIAGMKMNEITVVGGGLAGCEAAWQIAKAGFSVNLVEMRPIRTTGAHTSDRLAELVCSNSLGSSLRNRPLGLLQQELEYLGSFVLDVARQNQLPAGRALAVDRERFSTRVTELIETNPLIKVIRDEVMEIPDTPCVIASGPLTSDALAQSITAFVGTDSLFFYDAMAPIVTRDSIDMKIAFRASRYQHENEDAADYLNCPLSNAEYDHFLAELLNSKRTMLQENEQEIDTGVHAGKGSYFEACLPIEVLAARNPLSLAFGPMRPVGLTNTHDNSKPYAVVQLRQENLADSLYNLVGFQTNLTYTEQQRVFRLIPGLEQAEFVRFGQMHRNTYLCAPELLHATLQSQKREDLFFAGQLTGIEGYLGNIGSGLIAGINLSRLLIGKMPVTFPRETMLGSLTNYLEHADPVNFQPMKANLGLLPPLGFRATNKFEKGFAFANRSLRTLTDFCTQEEIGQ
jgi:methylenetetrahydrofolate--tRNA-(uracil-5-)-methyltransferase